MKKAYTIIYILLSATVFLMGCGESEEEKQKRLEEENARTLILHKLDVANDFCFWGVPWPIDAEYDMRRGVKTYNKVTFYASEKEAAKDYNVSEEETVEGEIYVMPTEKTYDLLDGLNWALKRDKTENEVEKYNLEYPIELEDIINQTEDVWQMLHDRKILSEDHYQTVLRGFYVLAFFH